ncbi:unnamed protein product [Symbiodinium natans]|uniref:Metallo-beta-lactamase domain-containing protein n=1 Tax=Symbiodinium natans TaxID=878477 RepID=A0A812J8V7_9DINO|nr:unnamed protein product [Symbiodinium natans]
MALTLHCLGTGAGRTAVYDGECSSSWALAYDRRPFFLADLGLGVCKQALRYLGEIPSTIFISHNHSDHAGELPVVLAVEGLQKRRPMSVIAEPEVLARLRVYRMHELLSTGIDMSEFATWVPAPEGFRVGIQSEAGLVHLTTHRAQHSELCFGARLDIGSLSVGWTSDSGFSPSLLGSLNCPSLLLIDARKVGGHEHASFKEIAEYVANNENVEFLGAPVAGHLFTPREGICQLAIIGYGSSAEAPARADGIPSSAVLWPGQVIVLKQAPTQRNSVAFIAGFLCGYVCSLCSEHLTPSRD